MKLLAVMLLAEALPLLPGLQMPVDFTRNEVLSVAGQDVFEHIDGGERNLVAITPHVRPRSIELLLRSGYRDWCPLAEGPLQRVLFHRREQGLTWFVIGEQRTAHIVLATGSRHVEFFIEQINRHCRD